MMVIRSLADFDGAPCGVWLDTDTVTVQGFKLRLGTTSKGWGFYSATSGGLSHGHGHQRYVTKPAACAALDTVPTAVTSADTGAEITRTSNPDQFDCANLPRDAARCASPISAPAAEVRLRPSRHEVCANRCAWAREVRWVGDVANLVGTR